jgi:hypothetical protein
LRTVSLSETGLSLQTTAETSSLLFETPSSRNLDEDEEYPKAIIAVRYKKLDILTAGMQECTPNILFRSKILLCKESL